MTCNNDIGGKDDEWGHHVEVPMKDQSDDDNEAYDELDYSSQEMRQMANVHFAQGDYDSALPLYSLALEALRKEQQLKRREEEEEEEEAEKICKAVGQKKKNHLVEISAEEEALYLCNRAACHFRMELFEDAKADAEEAVKITKGSYAKACFRLARSQMVLGEFANAVATLNDALNKIPFTDNLNNNNNNNNNKNEKKDTDSSKKVVDERQELSKLLITARTKLLQKEQMPNAANLAKVQSIRLEPRQPSIREFAIEREIGYGNFSKVVICRHKITNERFAMKIIEKKKAEELVKRQHPNVYNEINMERRILGEKLSSVFGKNEGHKRIIKLYHSFQDYNSLYFLMDLHAECGDLWGTVRFRNKMVGTHKSLISTYLIEILEALEHIHARGIIHRDLKPENVLLSPQGHIILIDFGTAKDLIQTDLNGPEFVGTPDFMAPEAVKGISSMEEVEKARKEGIWGGDHTIDLWAFGAVAFYLFTGETPFKSPSPYLTFLKIQRGNLRRPLGISDDNAWDLIEKLMKVDPKTRLGAECYKVEEQIDENNDNNNERNIIRKVENGYTSIRNHPFFASKKESAINNDGLETTVIPSLKDLCTRACVQLVQNDSMDLDMDKRHPPGDNSSHDLLRLQNKDKDSLMHLLDRLNILPEPRIYRRFFKTKQEARLTKVRKETRDFVGLTQILDNQGRFPAKEAQENENLDVAVTMDPIQFMHLSNPLFVKELNVNCTDDNQRKKWTLELKNSLKLVNRARPKALVASGYIDEECRKLLGKVNETIPVILNDGNFFYSFWICGAQGLILKSTDFMKSESEVSLSVSSSSIKKCDQMIWLREELEQSGMTRHHVFVFVDGDPHQLPRWLLRELAKGRSLCIFGIAKDGCCHETMFEYNNSSSKDSTAVVDEADIDEDKLQSSSDDEDNRIMKIVRKGDSSIDCVTLEEYGEWSSEHLTSNSL